jgi:hypothetical protein
VADFVTIEKGLGPEGRIAVVRFDRGDGINALSPKALRQFTDAARSFDDDNETSVVVLTGGPKACGLEISRHRRARNEGGPLDSPYALARRIRKIELEAELLDIEEEIDDILSAKRAKSASGDERAVDDVTLNVAAHRLENLIHDRRAILAKRPAVVSAA